MSVSRPSSTGPLQLRLSVVVITRNEGPRLGACLASVRFADEVVVLDSGSTDDTQAVAQAHGARFVAGGDWPGFGAQKNRAVALARGEWVLVLDADERVSAALRQQIEAALDQPAFDVYRLSRRSSYCGRYMRHSGWWPDRVPRLFRRGRARFSDDLVHERLLFDGPAGVLDGELLHESFDDFDAVLDKVNRYSSASAAQLAQQGRSATPWRAIGAGLWAFVRTWVLRRGFLDGWQGFALAVSNAEGSYYRYMKLWLLHGRRDPR